MNCIEAAMAMPVLDIAEAEPHVGQSSELARSAACEALEVEHRRAGATAEVSRKRGRDLGKERTENAVQA